MIQLTHLPQINKVNIESLQDESLQQAGIGMDVLRLDKIHTIISGNKWFKLKYYLEDTTRFRKKGIITLGGAYSNHLLAVAYACHQAQLSSVGIIRGEAPEVNSPTLIEAIRYGMQLKFLSRAEYSNEATLLKLKDEYTNHFFVNAGGRGNNGIKGAEEILHLCPANDYSHIICAVGTGTMMTGLINSAFPWQKVVGIPVLKLPDYMKSDVARYIANNARGTNYTFQTSFHFGGYAKKNADLIEFMNLLYARHNIPTDWVYTGKLFYAAMVLSREGFFDRGSKVLVIHSGGLQGNRSLPNGLLTFN